MTDWRPLAARLADTLAAAGVLEPDWRTAFESIPRHVFVPAYYTRDDELIDADDPARADTWLTATYTDEALTTQLRAAPGIDLCWPTSSSSQPSVMASMLRALDVRDEHRVLEIGTGTGYNAALLSYRLGGRRVFSIDLDSDLVDEARRHLALAGYHPTVTVTNGFDGLPDAAPFDRIVATCAVDHVPPAWIHQLASAGRIVAPLTGTGCALMVLDKTGDNEVTGRFDATEVAFMPMRPDVNSPLPSGSLGPAVALIGQYGTTTLDPTPLADEPSRDLLLFLQLHLPGLIVGPGESTLGKNVTLVTADGRAEVATEPVDERWLTLQNGRRLWDTVEHATALWQHLGEPARTRYGISALDDVARQYVWLDDPDSSYAWPMPL